MSLYSVLTALGDAIRSKTGTEDKLTLEQMAAKVQEIAVDPSMVALATGSFVPTASSVTITHGLGVVPEFIICTIDPDEDYTGYTESVIRMNRTYPYSGTEKVYLDIVVYYPSSATTVSTARAYGSASPGTEEATLASNSSNPFKTGATYKWIAFATNQWGDE